MIDARLKTLMRRTGNEALLRQYCARIHQDYDLAYRDALQLQQFPDMPFQLPNQEECEHLGKGDFSLGRIGRHKEELKLDLRKALPLGLSIVGGSGMGKTTLLSNIAHHLSQYPDVGCWLFNIRDEVNQGLPHFQNIGMSDILPNIFERKPYLKPDVQANKVADIIASTFFLLWTRSLIAKVLIDFYRNNQSPSLQQVRDSIANTKAGKATGLTSQQLSKLIGVFDYLMQSYGDARHLITGFQPYEYWDSKLIILNDVGKQDVQALLITYLLWSLYEHNLHHGLRNNLRTAFLIDESRYLLNLDRERVSADYGAPVLDDIICQQRSAGLALVAATQTAFPKVYATNTSTKVLLKTGDVRYYQLSAQSMGLNRQQTDFALLNCKVGDAVVTTQSFNRPLLVALNDIAFNQDTDTPTTFAKAIKGAFRYSKDVSEKQNKIGSNHRQEMVPHAGALLCFYAQHPLASFTEAIEALKLNREAGTKIINHLLGHKLITKEQVRLYKGRGRQPVLCELTESGKQWLQIHHPDIHPSTFKGKGSLEHRVHQHLVQHHFKEQGYLTELEKHGADLVIARAESKEWQAVEIFTEHSRNVQHRINANKTAGASDTIGICSSKKALQIVKKQLDCFCDVDVQDIEPYLLERKQR